MPASKNHRMTVDKDVSLDAARQAVRLTELEGSLQLTQQGLRASIEHLTGSVQAVQAEARAQTEAIHQLTVQQAARESDRTAVKRLEDAVGAMDRRLEDYFNDRDARDHQKWQAMANKVDDLDKRVSQWHNRLLGLGLAATLLGGAFFYFVNEKSDNITAAIETSTLNYNSNFARIERLQAKQHQIELYLARGGANAADPYAPPKE